MSTYSLILRDLIGPSGSTTKGAKLSISEVDGNFIYLKNLADDASIVPNGTTLKDQSGNVIFDPVNKVISNGYYTVFDFNSCFPFIPGELSVGYNLYVGGPWGSTDSDTQEAHKAIGWDGDNYRNIFYGDGSQLVNLPTSNGPQGPTGSRGAVGATGPAGNDGAVGATGPAGNDGAVGATGPAGNDGAVGATGPAGNDGAVGVTGPAGNDGAVGATGSVSLGITYDRVLPSSGTTYSMLHQSQGMLFNMNAFGGVDDVTIVLPPNPVDGYIAYISAGSNNSGFEITNLRIVCSQVNFPFSGQIIYDAPTKLSLSTGYTRYCSFVFDSIDQLWFRIS